MLDFGASNLIYNSEDQIDKAQDEAANGAREHRHEGACNTCGPGEACSARGPQWASPPSVRSARNLGGQPKMHTCMDHRDPGPFSCGSHAH